MGKTLAAEHQREVASLRTLADERQQEVIAARAELARVRASADRKVEKFESEDSDDDPSQPSKFGWKHRGSKDQRLLQQVVEAVKKGAGPVAVGDMLCQLKLEPNRAEEIVANEHRKGYGLLHVCACCSSEDTDTAKVAETIRLL